MSVPRIMNYILDTARFLLVNMTGHDPIHDYYGTSNLTRWQQNGILLTNILKNVIFGGTGTSYQLIHKHLSHKGQSKQAIAFKKEANRATKTLRYLNHNNPITMQEQEAKKFDAQNIDAKKKVAAAIEQMKLEKMTFINDISDLSTEIKNTILFSTFVNYIDIQDRKELTYFNIYNLIKHKDDASGVPENFYEAFSVNFIGWMYYKHRAKLFNNENMSDTTDEIPKYIIFKELLDLLEEAFDDMVIETTIFEIHNEVSFEKQIGEREDLSDPILSDESNKKVDAIVQACKLEKGGGGIKTLTGGDKPPCANCTANEARTIVNALTSGLSNENVLDLVNSMQYKYDGFFNNNVSLSQSSPWPVEYKKESDELLMIFIKLWSTTLNPKGESRFEKKIQTLKKEFKAYIPDVKPRRTGGRIKQDILSLLKKLVLGTMHDCLNIIAKYHAENERIANAEAKDVARLLNGDLSTSDLLARADFTRLLARSSLYFYGICDNEGNLTEPGSQILGPGNQVPEGSLLEKQINILRFIAMNYNSNPATTWPNAISNPVTKIDLDTSLYDEIQQIYPLTHPSRQGGAYICNKALEKKYIVNNAAMEMNTPYAKKLTFCGPSSTIDGMTLCPPSNIIGIPPPNGSGREFGDMNFKIQNSPTIPNSLPDYAYQGSCTLNADYYNGVVDTADVTINITLTGILGQLTIPPNNFIIKEKQLEAAKVLRKTLETFVNVILNPSQLINDPNFIAGFNNATATVQGVDPNLIFSRIFDYVTQIPNIQTQKHIFENLIWKDILYKGFGDISQEISCICRYGGYVAKYQVDTDVFSYYDCVNYPGWQIRLCVGGDRPSGIRSFVALTEGQPHEINMFARTGYYVDGYPTNDFIGKRPELKNFCNRKLTPEFVIGFPPLRDAYPIFSTRGGNLKSKKNYKTRKNMKNNKKNGRKTRTKIKHVRQLKI